MIKIALEVHEDSYNSYPNNYKLNFFFSDDFVTIEMENPKRTITVLRKDFMKLSAFTSSELIKLCLT